jgi:hypothetical protein
MPVTRKVTRTKNTFGDWVLATAQTLGCDAGQAPGRAEARHHDSMQCIDGQLATSAPLLCVCILGFVCVVQGMTCGRSSMMYVYV